GDDRRVIADTTAQMQNAVARREVEGIEPPSEGRRFTVVQASRRIERHEDVVAHVPGIAVGRVAIRPQIWRHENLPGSGTDEVFWGPRAEGARERRRPHPPPPAQSLRETTSGSLEVGGRNDSSYKSPPPQDIVPSALQHVAVRDDDPVEV